MLENKELRTSTATATIQSKNEVSGINEGISSVKFPSKDNKDAINENKNKDKDIVEKTPDYQNKKEVRDNLNKSYEFDKVINLSNKSEKELASFKNNFMEKTSQNLENIDMFDEGEKKDFTNAIIKNKTNILKLIATLPADTVKATNINSLKNFLLSSENKALTKSEFIDIQLGLSQLLNKNKVSNKTTNKQNDLILKVQETTNLLDAAISQKIEAVKNYNNARLETLNAAKEIYHNLSKIEDPDLAQAIKDMVGKCVNYANDPILFTLYGQYMKNMLSMLTSGNVKKEDIIKYEQDFTKIIDEVEKIKKSSDSPSVKSQNIINLVLKNKETINKDRDSISNEEINNNRVDITEIVKDILTHPELFISGTNNASEEKTDLPSVKRVNDKKDGGLLDEINNKIELVESEVKLGTPNMKIKPSPLGITQPKPPTSKDKALELVTGAPPDNNNSNTNSIDNKGDKASSSKVGGAFEVLLKNKPDNYLETIPKKLEPIKKSIENFNKSFEKTLKSTNNLYKLQNNIDRLNNILNSYKDKINAELSNIIKMLKGKYSDQSIDESEERVNESYKEILEDVIKTAQESEFILNSSEFHVDNNVMNSVQLLEKFREIIVDLDLGLRAIKNKVESGVKLDTNFMKESNELKKRKEKAEKLLKTIELDFKNSKEIASQKVSNLSKQGILKNDLKMLALFIQEVSINKIAVGMDV
ncbi:MAG: hypothetical protein U0457_02245 [Candidatus Sericytochromatia bacterium]